MKKVCKAAMEGIYLAAVMFLIACMVKGFYGGNETTFSGTAMAYSCIAAIVIGMGFGIPSLIYQTELPTALKVLIHMGIGCIVMLATSCIVGWIDISRGWLPCLLVAVVQIGIAFLLWALTCVRVRRDAKQMNKHLSAKQ